MRCVRFYNDAEPGTVGVARRRQFFTPTDRPTSLLSVLLVNSRASRRQYCYEDRAAEVVGFDGSVEFFVLETAAARNEFMLHVGGAEHPLAELHAGGSAGI